MCAHVCVRVHERLHVCIHVYVHEHVRGCLHMCVSVYISASRVDPEGLLGSRGFDHRAHGQHFGRANAQTEACRAPGWGSEQGEAGAAPHAVPRGSAGPCATPAQRARFQKQLLGQTSSSPWPPRVAEGINQLGTPEVPAPHSRGQATLSLVIHPDPRIAAGIQLRRRE